MAKVIFTPWKEQSQLLAVRDQFYPPPLYDGPDMRSRACATVGAWKLRGNLPHPVEATALLTDAILHDDAQKNSIFSIRATYAAAFCRFVTCLVDSKLGGQRRTMFQRALDLGLPASFVELRHEATHRELPSLTVLRNASQRSLEWLWDYYWAKTEGSSAGLEMAVRGGVVANREGDEGEEEAEEVDLEPLKSALRDTLQQVVAEGVEQPPRKKRKVQQHLSAVTNEVVSACRSSGRGVAALSSVLVQDSLLVSETRRLGDSMADDFDRWDPLLQRIADAQSTFLSGLTEELVDALALTARPDEAKTEPRCEGIYLWLDHILGSAQWESRRRLISYAYMLAACEQGGNHWTNLLRERLAERQDEGIYGLIASVLIAPPHRSQLLQHTPVPHGPSLHKINSFNCSVSSIEVSIHIIQSHAYPIDSNVLLWTTAELSPGTGKGNNYAYLVTDEPTKQSVIIDPANPPEVTPELESQINAGKIELTAIVNTHHHWDHAGGNNELLKTFGKLPVIGGKDCQSVTQTPAHGETFKIGERISVKALHTPCHTQDSICYFMQDGDEKVVFTGDTLFIGGCGRFFEGTAPEMHKALNETLAALPDDTRVYPGHEYTKGNVKFCLAVSESEPIKKLAAFAEANQETQGKFTIGDEKLHNVFMRVNDPEIQQKTGKTDPVEVMAALREMKNAM
ncbi:Las1-domain-containing protein [Aspergillus saccharolyticus JOP 1030-1]|uniref:hydroxyacylglutathione hydrolase n=1 Tax=Aspergillus saccharolyticus JOP 1030-1 TaxID=1450539 RepID=A0A318ZUR4_9EURO|nr:Las1-domain-containing protein [Aspergillus saccharolyticus JOP 1030-1]PYH43828.1 Las1-domain-containing protein [Aspergillus saccharolyticus JOP 1030-1]